MSTLYRNINGTLHYWETWNPGDNTAIFHWGIVGEGGRTKEVKSSFLSTHVKKIEKETKEQLQNGYKEISLDDQFLLLIEYKVDDMGTPEDLLKGMLYKTECRKL